MSHLSVTTSHRHLILFGCLHGGLTNGGKGGEGGAGQNFTAFSTSTAFNPSDWKNWRDVGTGRVPVSAKAVDRPSLEYLREMVFYPKQFRCVGTSIRIRRVAIDQVAKISRCNPMVTLSAMVRAKRTFPAMSSPSASAKKIGIIATGSTSANSVTTCFSVSVTMASRGQEAYSTYRRERK